MKKEIYVHIGLHKTGTTSIQKMLHTNADLLLSHGICYPTICENHSIFLYSMFAITPEKWGYNVRLGYTTKEEIKKVNDCYRAKLLRELRNPKISKVVFSGEELASLSEEEVKNFSHWLRQFSDNITIICATRNPIDWYSSCIQQTLKSRKSTIATRCQDIMSKNNARIPKYKNILKYINFFGDNAVKVFDFDRHKTDLCSYFLTLCKFDQSLIDAVTSSAIVTNVSLSQEASFILERLNIMRPRSSEYPEAYYETETAAIAEISGHKFKLPDETLEKLIQHYLNDIDWISNYFKEECGSYIQQAKNFKVHDDKITMFQEKTVDDIALLISRLTHEIYKLKKERFSAIFLFKRAARKIVRIYKKACFSAANVFSNSR